ncbi:unnamed protein product [marine sediment metagenome]|uniref:Uncharacterized protein n=1 Tax=marine sediment metagenome TaxID=412755 RepID=X1S7A0_9ZZZZ
MMYEADILEKGLKKKKNFLEKNKIIGEDMKKNSLSVYNNNNKHLYVYLYPL